MTNTPSAPTPSHNREIIDDREDRLSIHTHQIRLTQAHLPYQPVPGKRLPSVKDFEVFADQIILAGPLQNPGRQITLNAREIVIEAQAILDVVGADPDQDFAPGTLPIQKDVQPGAAGTDGADASDGGNGGMILINARQVVDRTTAAKALSAIDIGTIGAQLLAAHPPAPDNAAAMPPFKITKTIFKNDMVVQFEDCRIEGFAHLALQFAHFDGHRISMRLDLPALTVTSKIQTSASPRIASQAFGCTVDATVTIQADGTIGTPAAQASLVADTAISLPFGWGDAALPAAILKIICERIVAHLRDEAIEPLLAALAGTLRNAALILLADGGPGGRGQDGHPGVRGPAGADGAKTSKSGIAFPSGISFPDEAFGQNGLIGGRAGAPGRSGDGGKGGRVVLNILDPVLSSLIYGVGGGAGGTPASPGERGPGGHGGRGAMCHIFDSKTGRPVEDMRAPDGRDGPTGPIAEHLGADGKPGTAGAPLQINGTPFVGGPVPALTFAALAQALSLSQLLITQNATDLDFLNAKTEADRTDVAQRYAWLIDINRPFAEKDAAIDAARVSPTEQSVRGGIHDSAIVALMRLQQGLDYYGHSYNWAPVLTLNTLIARTEQIIQLGKVVEDQYNRYLDRGATNAQRMDAFRTAKQEIDRKLADFLSEIDKLKPQIDNFQTEVEDYTEDLRHQRTRLLEGQLEFQDELDAYLREQNGNGLDVFLDMLGTVIGCVGGVAGGIGGIKTGIDAIKKAAEFSAKVKGVVEIFKNAKATIDSISKAYSTIRDYIDNSHPDAAKILVDSDEFDTMIKDYLGKFDAAGELRKAMDYYLQLAQARNMAAYNYSTLVAQLLSIQTQHDQLYHGIEHLNAEIAAHQDNLLPIYTAFLKDSHEDVQRNLLRNIYLENRAYHYWSLQKRPLETSNLTIADQAVTHQRLIEDIDSFRENNEAFSDFRQKLTITAEQYPDEFAAMVASRSLAFAIDIRNQPGFQNLRYIIARAFKLEFPDIVGGTNVLFLNFIHSGQALLNRYTDLDKADALHLFSHRPRIRPYRIDYKDRANTAGGNLGEGDQGYIGVSPFAQWRIDFDIPGNEWLDLSAIRTVELTFEGRMLGPGRRLG